MHEAYSVSSVATKLPLAIESIACDEQSKAVLAGTKPGTLLTYSAPDESGHREYSPQMCKNFARKSVMQLQVLSELRLLICLADSVITVHDCTQVNYLMVNSLPKTKGASAFATEMVKRPAANGELYSVAVLSVVVKRRVLLFFWKNREFVELNPGEFSCPDVARTLTWCWPHSIALEVCNEYFLVSLEVGKDNQSGQLTSLFTTGSRAIVPLIFKIRNKDILGFLRDDRTVFRNYNGSAIPELSDITWSGVPIAIESDCPYLIALLPSGVEIRTLRPSILVQTIDLNRPKYISFCSRCRVFVGSESDLWRLSASSNLMQNIHRLVKDRQYDIAVQLAEIVSDGSPEEKEKRIKEIKHLWAFYLFCQRKFKEAFHLYSEIQTEVLYVIGLFPDLLPSDLRRGICFPGELPKDFSKADFENGLLALTAYLSEIRTNIARDLDLQNRLKPDQQQLRLPESQLSEMKNFLQIVDTTLLKCYLQTNDVLVASLLRLPDNSSNVVESERVLREHKKFSELFLLYERKGMHVEALELLFLQSKNPSSPLKGVDRAIGYLQNLGAKHLDLIMKYAGWILRENEKEGLKIFTDDHPEVEALPRDQVLDYLRHEAYNLVIPYLEHVVLQWVDENQKFHDALAEQYVTRVKLLMEEYLQSLPEGHTVAPAGKEPGELGNLRNRLLYFLGFSQYYSPELLIAQIPHDALYEERAIILGHMGRHEQTIAIYTNILHDYDKAENYCRTAYVRNQKDAADVFLTLLRMYAHPPENSVVGIMHSSLPKPPPNVKLALKVLRNYAMYIDTVKAVELLPEDIRLEELWIALEALLNETAILRKEAELHRGLYYSQFLRAQQQKIRIQSIKLLITHDSICTKCKKKISNSAFAQCPDGTLAHYFCFRETSKSQV